MALQFIHIGAHPTPFDGGAATRVFAVIGHPVQHSLSPRFQNAALGSLGMDATYVAIDVSPDELSACVPRMRAAAKEGRLAGVNVTVPHKMSIAMHLDALDAQASGTGAVNTICFSKSGDSVHAEGRNTDVDGILAALQDAEASMRGADVVVLGAGGAARAAVWAALRAGAAEICVANRSPERARELVERISVHWPRARTGISSCGLHALPNSRLRRARILIQATSLGLDAGDPSPVDLGAASTELFVLDLIYHRDTALLRDARGAGLRAINGIGMLVHQGAASLRAWTDLEPPLEVMKRSLDT
jgi:shikimate dehydrogenase